MVPPLRQGDGDVPSHTHQAKESGEAFLASCG